MTFWRYGGLAWSIATGLMGTVSYYLGFARRYKETLPLEQLRLAHILFHILLVAFYTGALFLQLEEMDTLLFWFVGSLYTVMIIPTLVIGWCI